jgi:hypothetical protein
MFVWVYHDVNSEITLFTLYFFFLFSSKIQILIIFQNRHNAKPITLFQTNRKIRLLCEADIGIEITLLYLKSCRGQLGINATVKQYHGMKAQYKYGNVQTQIVIVCVMSACFRYKYGMVKSPLSSIPMSASQRSLIFLFDNFLVENGRH